MNTSLVWPRFRRKPNVTLIIGIICKDAIVLAADSQTTKGSAKQTGTNKITEIDFLNGKALVAEAGSASLSNRVVELYKRAAALVQIENESTVAKQLETAVREVRNSLMALHPNVSPKEMQDFFYDQTNYFELMVAYYFKEKPYLYKINPLWGIPVPASQYFETSGIASELANFILKEHTSRDMDSQFGSVIAIKTVQDAIEYVEGCGAPIRVAVIRKPLLEPAQKRFALGYAAEKSFIQMLSQIGAYQPSVVVFPEEKVSELAEIIAKVEKQAKDGRNKNIHAALRKQTEKSYHAIEKMLRAEMGEQPDSSNPAIEILLKKKKDSNG